VLHPGTSPTPLLVFCVHLTSTATDSVNTVFLGIDTTVIVSVAGVQNFTVKG